MKNELEELLDNPRIIMLSFGNFILLDDYVKLKDYITNLQQENNNLKISLDESQEVANDLEQENKKLEERIYKALHLITHSDITDYRVFDEELLDILNGKEGD